MTKATFAAGDRIALAARFLRDTGQRTGGASERRGTFLGFMPGMEKTHARVRWDDFETCVTLYSGLATGQYGDPEWVQDCRENGSLVGLNAIAKVGSARFCLTDM